MNAVPSPLELFGAVPHARMEGWKYSNLRSLLDSKSFEHPGKLSIVVAGQAQGIEIITNNALPDWASRVAAKTSTGGAMEKAARSLEPKIIAIRVPNGTDVAKPLELRFEGAGNGHVVLLIERGASLSLVEAHRAHSNSLRNVSFSILLEDGAQLTHFRTEPHALELISVETVGITLGRGSSYRAHFSTQGAKLSRTELHAALEGEGAHFDLSGVSVLGDGAHADVTTHIDHRIGHTTSTQLIKAVVGGKSRAVYQGKITVREGADVSDSRQTAKGILLGARAEIDLKPELEILADDVKCAHGAAVGDLDTDSLFYLRARGIPEVEARALLIRAFLEEAVEGIANEDIRAKTWDFVEAGLARAMEAAT